MHVLALRQLCVVRSHWTRPARSSSGSCRCATILACSPSKYDPAGKRLLGNFPQAFSHVSLINTALNLTRQHGPAHDRRGLIECSRAQFLIF